MANDKNAVQTPRLFLFGIGGTGSRVLKSLAFLLASGVEAQVGTIVPIIIDPDTANGDMERTLQILDLYRSIRKKVHRTKAEGGQFFQTDIQTLAGVYGDGGEVRDSFRFDISGTRDGVFRKFIDYPNLEEADRALVNLLFSEKNLDSELSVGFKGNPHMGSVVLNQFKDSIEFRAFASKIGPNDRIFIVSSIFGGTGAAGFPLLVKNIRDAAKEDLPNADRLSKTPIGAITVQPYFGVAPDRSIEINKNTFIGKTKAALAYYSSKMNGVNALYYIGDNTYTRDQKAAEGRRDQENDAHVLEMFSALAVLHFLTLDSNQLRVPNGKPQQQFFYEYGTYGNPMVLNLRNLGPQSRKTINRPLTQFAFTVNFWNQQFQTAIQQQKPWTKERRVKFNSEFTGSSFYYDDISRFTARFSEWIKEMARTERAFDPYHLDTSQPQYLVKEYDPAPTRNLLGMAGRALDYDAFNAMLDAASLHGDNLESPQKFLAMFHEATAELIRKHYGKNADFA